MSLEPGTTLGPYAVAAKIGEGGMGEVYRARDTKLDRDVALKVLPPAFTDDPDRLARFEREAKVLASLNHPNIGGIHGLEESDGVRALVLEYIEGPTLADRIRQGPIPVDEALPIAKQIAEALEAAHEQGVIHRDLKPANIKLKPDGTVKVLDFGLAKAFQPEASDVSASMSPTISLTAAATQMGMVIGTAAYMSPEQAKGKPVDARADVWAFGAVLFEMLSGERPFVGDDVSDTLALVLKFEPDWVVLPEDVPAGVRRLVKACLDKQPKQRVQAIGDVRLALDGVFDLTAATAAEEGASARDISVRRVVLAASLAALGTALLAGTLWYAVAEPAAPRQVNRFGIDLPAAVQFQTQTTFPVALSRDGRHLVFNGAADGVSQIYLRSFDEIAPVPIRGAEGSRGSLFLSPDGEWVAFNDTTDNTFKRVRVSGGPPATISETGMSGGGFRGASWGSRGEIVFATQASPGLVRVSDVGGAPEPLTTPQQGAEHGWPYFLPGGDALLFQTNRAGEPDRVAALDLGSGEIHLLLEGAGPHYVVSGHLLFAREGTVWAAAFDPDRFEVLGDPVPVLEAVGFGGISRGYPQISVADDGTLVYVSARPRGTRSIVWVDREGREEPLPGIPPDQYTQVEMSPDGGRLALAGSGDIWIYDLRRATLTPLTTDPAVDRSPVWDDDGRIVFASSRNGVEEVFVRASDGTGPAERILGREGAAVLSPQSWSPDGSTLFLTEIRDSLADIVALRSNDGQAQAVIATEAVEAQPYVSPDGRWLAYGSNLSGRAEVYVQRYPDLGDRRQISVSGGQLPRWSPDGRELYFLSLDGRQLLAVEVDADSSEPWGTPVTLFVGRFLAEGGGARAYDVAPDGRFVVITAMAALEDSGDDARPDLVVVQNWDEELKRLVPVP